MPTGRRVRDFLLALPDPDDFDFYLNEAADVGGIHEWIPRVIEAEPGSVLPTCSAVCTQ